MVTAKQAQAGSQEQVKALIRSHADGDDTRFYAIAMQVAAQVARSGHGKFAQELRKCVDDAKAHSAATEPARGPMAYPRAQPRGELALQSIKLDISQNAYALATLVSEVKALREQVAALTSELRTRKQRAVKRRRTVHQALRDEIMAGPNPPTEAEIARARKLLR